MIDAINPQGTSLPNTYVNIVPQFYGCLTALASFMTSGHSPIIIIRYEKMMIVIHDFMNIAGSGFGGTLLQKGKIHYCIGTWSSCEDLNSSNWQELEILYLRLKKQAKRGG